MRDLAIVRKPTPISANLVFDIALAKEEIGTAWEQYKHSTVRHFRDGLEFGRTCHQWQASYKAQGSHKGKGFEHILERLKIPKTTAYRWIRRYEVRAGLRAGRNEVLQLNPEDRPSGPSARRRVLFTFFLTDEQHKQLDEDIKRLGGHGAVVELILRAISRAALEAGPIESPNTKVRNSSCPLPPDKLVVGI